MGHCYESVSENAPARLICLPNVPIIKGMAATAKRARSKPKAKSGAGNGTARRAADRALDAEHRKRIGKTLDATAFLKHHRTNSSSARHWETPE